MATRQLVPNLPQFRAMKNRISELYQNCGETMRNKDKDKTVLAASNIFSDMEHLVGEIKRLGADHQFDEQEASRLKKINRFVRRVCSEQAAAIKTGQFIRISPDIFGAYRFLVRTLEKVIVGILDDDDALEIRNEKLADEHSDRITLDLTEGVSDPDDDDVDDDGTDIDGTGAKKPARRTLAPRAPVAGAPMSGLGLGKIDNDDLPGGDLPGVK